jgi:hypothetical protein
VSEQNVSTYLNDHLAGAVAAVGLLEQLEKRHAGEPVARFVAGLRADIEADRAELQALMGRLGLSESAPRKAAGWLASKATEAKLWMDDSAGGPLRLLETLEAVAVGVEGKRALWRALAAASEANPRLRGTDFGRLVRRAEEQRDRVEGARLEAARAALAAT